MKGLIKVFVTRHVICFISVILAWVMFFWNLVGCGYIHHEKITVDPGE